MRDKYGVNHDAYCYPDTGVLVNVLGIHNDKQLEEAEAAFSAERYRTYQSPPRFLVDFNLSHLQHLHHYLFQDLYSWAGELRTVDIAKGNTRFCTCSRIQVEADKLFAKIPSFKEIKHKERVILSLVDLFCELNLVHPFRDGNGRVLRFFFEELVFTLGYEISWPKISKEDWISANVSGVNLDLAPLTNIFKQAIS